MSFQSFRMERGDSDRWSEDSHSVMGSVAESDRWKVTDRTSRLARFKEKQMEVLQAVKQRQGRERQESQGAESMVSDISRQCSPAVSAGQLKSTNLTETSKLSSSQLAEMSSKMDSMGFELGSQQRQLQELANTAAAAASQKSLEECIMRMEEQHQIHLEEMHRLQQSFANDSELLGLRVELDASKKREQSLETQQVLLERTWADEKVTLEKELARLRAREATLVQQLQRAIVEVPSPVEKSAPVKPRCPTFRAPRGFWSLAVGIAGFILASMTVHFKWRKSTPDPRSIRTRPFGWAKHSMHLRA